MHAVTVTVTLCTSYLHFPRLHLHCPTDLILYCQIIGITKSNSTSNVLQLGYKDGAFTCVTQGCVYDPRVLDLSTE